jgi:P27 family predicted phage terminase small subunit
MLASMRMDCAVSHCELWVQYRAVSVIQLGGGRPRKPTAVKEAEGTDRPDRRNAAEPIGEPIAIGEPPQDLSPIERKSWATLASVIGPMRIMTNADRVAFLLLVQSLAIVQGAHASLRAAGGAVVYADDHGKVRPRPELAIVATHQRLLFGYLSRFGLTPADRSRVMELGQQDAHAEFAEFAQ